MPPMPTDRRLAAIEGPTRSSPRVNVRPNMRVRPPGRMPGVRRKQFQRHVRARRTSVCCSPGDRCAGSRLAAVAGHAACGGGWDHYAFLRSTCSASRCVLARRIRISLDGSVRQILYSHATGPMGAPTVSVCVQDRSVAPNQCGRCPHPGDCSPCRSQAGPLARRTSARLRTREVTGRSRVCQGLSLSV
jgi:hypothetical protein